MSIVVAEPHVRLHNICDKMKQWIAHGRAEIDRKRRTIAHLNGKIGELEAQANPDTAQIAALKERVAALEAELELDIPQQQAMEEEFSASCVS